MITAVSHRRGFTIVELLIVIVAIAILAAVSTVSYLGIQERSRASSASSALVGAAKKIALWQVDNPGTTPGSLEDVGITNTASASYQYARLDGNAQYCITATVGPTSYYINFTANKTPTKGGVAAIANRVVNPSFESTLSGVSSGSYMDTSFALSRVTTGGHSGQAFARGTANTASTGYGGGLVAALHDLPGGK